MAKKDWILHFGIILFGVIFVIESLRLGLGNFHSPRAGLLPFITGALLILVTSFCVLKNFLTAKRENIRNREKLFRRSVGNAVIIVVALFVYVFIMPWFGYLPSTFILLIFLFRIGGFRRWAYILAVAILTVCISHLIFGFWLSIRFPKGFLGF